MKMSKYDFGYEIQKGSTMEWAFGQIRNKSEVLELGPAIGTLTKHLKEKKECAVDIIEIDEESGVKAAQYARSSYIGNEKGDLEKKIWYNELRNRQYDYIVILDVLEHLRDAAEILEHLKQMLKKDGEILLSLPNVAHNSVIINLFRNKFEYTDVGLLDRTHLHFYTYESLIRLLEKVGLKAFEKKVLQLRVGEDEIMNSYSDVPIAVQAALRTREYADVYQFLFRITKRADDDRKEVPLLVENLPYTLYQCVVMNTEKKIIKREFFNPRNGIQMHLKTESEAEKLRITPMEDFCVLKNISIKGTDETGKEYRLPVDTSTAAQLEELFIFMDKDPQIFIYKPAGISSVTFEADVLTYGDSGLQFVFPLWKQNIEQKVQIEDYALTQQRLYDYIATKEEYIKEILAANTNYVDQIHQLEALVRQREE